MSQPKFRGVGYVPSSEKYASIDFSQLSDAIDEINVNVMEPNMK